MSAHMGISLYDDTCVEIDLLRESNGLPHNNILVCRERRRLLAKTSDLAELHTIVDLIPSGVYIFSVSLLKRK